MLKIGKELYSKKFRSDSGSLKVDSPSYCPMKRLFFNGLRIQKIVSTRLMYRNITAVKTIFLPVEKWALGTTKIGW